MAKVKKIKKRIKIIPVFFALIILSVVGYISYILLDMPINNILIKGNNILADQEIIELANIEDYPSFLRTTSHGIKKKLIKNPYIHDIKVKKKIFNKLVIEIDENRILYIDKLQNKMVLSDNSGINIDKNSIGVATLVNEVAEKYQRKFIKKMLEIDEDILRKVSEIKYEPTDLDKGRFLFSMTDGNYVYLTLTKFKNINYYEDVRPQLEGKKGILYLDSGNHFVEVK